MVRRAVRRRALRGARCPRGVHGPPRRRPARELHAAVGAHLRVRARAGGRDAYPAVPAEFTARLAGDLARTPRRRRGPSACTRALEAGMRIPLHPFFVRGTGCTGGSERGWTRLARVVRGSGRGRGRAAPVRECAGGFVQGRRGCYEALARAGLERACAPVAPTLLGVPQLCNFAAVLASRRRHERELSDSAWDEDDDSDPFELDHHDYVPYCTSPRHWFLFFAGKGL